jgi:hypothetical protein
MIVSPPIQGCGSDTDGNDDAKRYRRLDPTIGQKIINDNSFVAGFWVLWK